MVFGKYEDYKVEWDIVEIVHDVIGTNYKTPIN